MHSTDSGRNGRMNHTSERHFIEWQTTKRRYESCIEMTVEGSEWWVKTPNVINRRIKKRSSLDRERWWSWGMSHASVWQWTEWTNESCLWMPMTGRILKGSVPSLTVDEIEEWFDCESRWPNDRRQDGHYFIDFQFSNTKLWKSLKFKI